MCVNRSVTMSSQFLKITLFFGLAIGLVSGKILQKDTVSLSETEAVAGNVANLPCDTKPPLSGDRVHLIIWYKEPSETPIYSVDARGNKAPEQARHWADKDVLGSRASFRLNDVPSQLTIESVKDTDGGVYRCRVDFKKSPTRNTKVNLTIIIPPKKLVILDEKGDPIKGLTLGTFNEGMSVNISCISSGGRPLPRVTWWQENALLDDTFEAISDHRVRNVLHFGKLERHHLDTVLTCQAVNNNHMAPISTAVILDMNLKPLWVKLEGENHPLSAERSYELICTTVGGRPPPEISWLKGSILMRNAKTITSSDGNKTTSILRFVPTIEDSGKFLSCRAGSQLIAESNLEDGWKLNIYHVPIVTLELGSNINSSYIHEGMNVYFECNIKSNPWIYKVTWKHNGQELSSNTSTATTTVSNQSLVLHDVKREQTGIYTCVASNREGDGESNTVYLDVKYAPVCKTMQHTVIGIARHEASKLNCDVDSNPTDVQFFWKFNSSVTKTLDIPPSQFSMDRTRSQLTYTPHSERDYGSLLCWAKNDVGEQTQPCVLHIFPAGKPDGLSNCSLLNVTSDSVEVDCMQGFDGGLPQLFVIRVYDSINNVLLTNITSEVPWFLVESLKSASSYRIELFATNSKGQSEIVILNAHTLKPERQTNSFHLQLAASPVILQLTPLLGVVMGMIASLVLVALAILLALRFRGNKKRHARIPNEDMKVSCASIDSIEKNPDIIPLNNENKFEDSKTGQKTNSHQQQNLRPCIRNEKDDVTYAELALPSSVYSSLLKSNPQQTVYAQIDPCNTPLIKPTKESMAATLAPIIEEDTSTSQTQIVTRF